MQRKWILTGYVHSSVIPCISSKNQKLSHFCGLIMIHKNQPWISSPRNIKYLFGEQIFKSTNNNSMKQVISTWCRVQLEKLWATFFREEGKEDYIRILYVKNFIFIFSPGRVIQTALKNALNPESFFEAFVVCYCSISWFWKHRWKKSI